MKKFQIVQKHGDTANTAGEKAPRDVRTIAKKDGFQEIIIYNRKGIIPKLSRQINYYKQWKKVYKKIPNNSILLFQFPVYGEELGKYRMLKLMKLKKKIKLVLLVHDINFLRLDKTKGTRENKRELNDFKIMFSVADQIIAHNEKMVQYLNGIGISKDKLINLQIFDYLPDRKRSISDVVFKKSVIIAGNLSVEKSGYLNELNKIKCNFELFGPNFSLNKFSNVHYSGSFLPEEVPLHLNSGFGLIWDGDKIDTCSGITGNYLKYINPHKLSLYLSSGLPVIIWSQAAEATFVEKYDVGITVNSLLEIPQKLENISKERYENLAKNSKNIGKKLLNGDFTTKALNIAVERINR